MSDSQIERDHKISRKKPAKKAIKKSSNFSEGVKLALEVAKEYAETTLVILYIVNGFVASAILFDVVNSPERLNHAVAALSLGYSAIGFLMFISRGVKHQIAERKSEK